jgi:cytochrome c-type biogenesis protein CcmE
MKKFQLVLLVFIAIAIATLVSLMGSITTYETIASARQKEGKSVKLYVHLDHSQPMEYNPSRDPNFFTFYAADTLGNKTKVVCNFEKPIDFEKSDAIVITGSMHGQEFDIKNRDGILLKCPSKYKDDPAMAKKGLDQN